MKAFLYNTLEDASLENETFGSVVGGVWALPYVVISGDRLGAYWLPYSPELAPYSSTGEIANFAYEELCEDDQPISAEDYPNIIE